MAQQVESRIVQIRWHGRGGQGVVTASTLLVEVALDEGLFFQATPDFGAERSGAPIAAYTRLSDAPIHGRTPVTNPDIVVVLDSTLVGRVNLLAGLASEGLLLFNSRASAGEVREEMELTSQRVAVVDATRIAMETIGRNIPNVPILGALLRVEDVLSIDTARTAIERRLSERFNENVVRASMEALERGYSEVTEG